MGRLRDCCCCAALVRWADTGGGTDEERATRRVLIPVWAWIGAWMWAAFGQLYRQSFPA
eukprot:gene7264-7447_t